MFGLDTKRLIDTVFRLSRHPIILDTDESDTPEYFVFSFKNPCKKEVSLILETTLSSDSDQMFRQRALILL